MSECLCTKWFTNQECVLVCDFEPYGGYQSQGANSQTSMPTSIFFWWWLSEEMKDSKVHLYQSEDICVSLRDICISLRDRKRTVINLLNFDCTKSWQLLIIWDLKRAPNWHMVHSRVEISSDCSDFLTALWKSDGVLMPAMVFVFSHPSNDLPVCHAGEVTISWLQIVFSSFPCFQMQAQPIARGIGPHDPSSSIGEGFSRGSVLLASPFYICAPQLEVFLSEVACNVKFFGVGTLDDIIQYVIARQGVAIH